MKRTVSILIAVLMMLSVFSICTAYASPDLPDTDGQGGYRIDVVSGHAENDDGDTITYAKPGTVVDIYRDDERPIGTYDGGISMNGEYMQDRFSFTMPEGTAYVYFVLENQQLMSIDLTGNGKHIIDDADRNEILGVFHFAEMEGFITQMETGYDIDQDGNADIIYQYATEKPYIKRLATCNLKEDFYFLMERSGRKYNLLFTFGIPKINKSSTSLGAGKTDTLKVLNGGAKSWTSSNRKVAVVSTKGVVTGLKKGTATITATTYSGKKLTCKVNVTSNPKLSKNSVSVKRGKTVKVNIIGKAAVVKNVYTNTSFAKITSKNTATKLTVKGLKKGTTTLKVKVNGVVLKLKVKVK